MTRKRSIVERVEQLLEDGIPRFRGEIVKTLNLKSNYTLADVWKFGHISRSKERLDINTGVSVVKAYAYSSINNAGKTLTWKFNGQTFKATFKAKKKDERKTIRKIILKVLKESDVALFSDEIWTEVRKDFGRRINIRSVKNKLTELYRSGKISRLDRSKGWKFARGFLYGLNRKQIKERLAITDGELSVYTEVEMGIAKNVENAVKRASDIRDELGFNISLITWLSRKLGSESEYYVKSEGKGKSYRIKLVKRDKANLRGKGLIPWLKFIKVGGELIFYDNRLPFGEVKEKISKIAYWITEEGKRRRQIGLDWERLCQKVIKAIDRKREWQLNVLEHKERWKGRSGREFDHVYECILGPKEFGDRQYIVIECKAGILTSHDVDEYWRKLINEPEFRNYEDGGLKANVKPYLMIGKTIRSRAVLKKCRRRGIRVVFRTDLQDAYLRLTGQKINYKEIFKK